MNVILLTLLLNIGATAQTNKIGNDSTAQNDQWLIRCPNRMTKENYILQMTLVVSLKNVELYSWKVGEKWKYTLMWSTKQRKSSSFVKKNPVDIDTLLLQIACLNIPQPIVWIYNEQFRMPPDSIQLIVKSKCKEVWLPLKIERR